MLPACSQHIILRLLHLEVVDAKMQAALLGTNEQVLSSLEVWFGP